ncbi:MAG: hypothetical protein F4X98_05205 [Gammaproteobacteria bacterium]|nr:hypothetical protein [Gammaproteobacteria bacterium]
MATQAERITALEVHYEHVDKTLTAMSATLDAFRAEFGEFRTHLDGKFNRIDERFERIDERFERIDGKFERIDERFERIDERFERIQNAIADDRVERSETKLRVALRVIGWLAGVVTAVLGAVVGGLFVFARFLLPKLGELASLAQDTAPLVG